MCPNPAKIPYDLRVVCLLTSSPTLLEKTLIIVFELKAANQSLEATRRPNFSLSEFLKITPLIHVSSGEEENDERVGFVRKRIAVDSLTVFWIW
jgi:hypothetical protein